MFKKQLSLPVIGLISLSVTVLIVIIAVIMSILEGQAWSKSHVEITGYPDSMPSEQVESLGLQLKNLLILKAGATKEDKVKAVIRGESYGTKTENDITTANFLIDIEQFKQTYKVVMDWSEKTVISDGIVIRCPATKESKFPESHCESMYDNTEMANTMDKMKGMKDFPMVVDEFDFGARRAIHYEIRGAVLEDGSVTINIVDYSGGEKDAAMELLKSRGYEIDDNMTVNYHDESGGY